MTDRERVAQEACTCEKCVMCGGTGYIIDRESWSGLDHEACEDCCNVISAVCPRCELLADLDRGE